MLKLFVFILSIFLFFNLSLADQKNSNNSCTWDNRNKTACVEITSLLSNSSQFSKLGTNKVVISKKQIEQIGATDLIDVLKYVPDINITQSGPKGQTASLFMRGTGSNHTLVMINGIPISDQSLTQGLHDYGVDFIQTIQQIEIYPGSSASHFGSNAIGGAVNIILTGDFKDSISINSDSKANYELTTNKTFIYDNSSLNLKFGNVKNDTISVLGNYDDEKDKVENYTTNINYENFINNENRLYNHLYLRQTIAEYDGSSTKQTGYEVDNKMGSFQIGLENLNNTNKNNYVAYYNIFDRKYDERGTIDTYESSTLGLKYDKSKIVSNKISYGIGSEYKYDWGQFINNGSYEASTKGNSDNLTLYSNIGWNVFRDTTFSFFLRGDKHKYTGTNKTFKLNFNQEINNINFGTSVMTGLRNPTLYEMFGTDNYGYSGNRDLNPEKSNTYEVYSNLNFNKHLKFSLRAFKSNIKNNIEYISNKYRNDTDDIDLNQSGLNSEILISDNKMRLSLFSSILSSKKENNSDQLRRPKKNYGFNLSKEFTNIYLGSFNFNLTYNHYGKHFDTHSSTFKTVLMDSTDLLNLKLTKKNKNKNYYLKITNLLNENYERPHGYNQDRRIIKFGFKY